MGVLRLEIHWRAEGPTQRPRELKPWGMVYRNLAIMDCGLSAILGQPWGTQEAQRQDVETEARFSVLSLYSGYRMGIREKEDELFREWKLKRPGLVADGVVNEDTYLASFPRLLFVLKEVNDTQDGGGWDLRDELKKGGRPQTWDNITRWVEGIRRLPEEIPWGELRDVDEERRCHALSSIAAINLKKSPGSHTADPVALSETAKEDRVFLNRQFAIYEPDLVICCGTSDLLHRLIDFEPINWRQTRRGIWFHEIKTTKRFVVDYAHPMARVEPCLLYYGLMDAVREFLGSVPSRNPGGRPERDV